MLDLFFNWMSKYYGREITETDVIKFFHDNKNENELMKIEVIFGNYSGQYQEIDCKELCTRFQHYQLMKKIS